MQNGECRENSWNDRGDEEKGNEKDKKIAQ